MGESDWKMGLKLCDDHFAQSSIQAENKLCVIITGDRAKCDLAEDEEMGDISTCIGSAKDLNVKKNVSVTFLSKTTGDEKKVDEENFKSLKIALGCGEDGNCPKDQFISETDFDKMPVSFVDRQIGTLL